MKSFFFDGEISASKSILNRLLVIQSFSSSVKVFGESNCDDVIRMRSALQNILSGDGPANCGAAGTTLRFLALRASRIPGQHLLVGTPELLARPQSALIELIKGLGSKAQKIKEGLLIEGNGWIKPSGPLRVDRSQSSQFASAALLSAWNLDFDLELEMSQSNEFPSEGYFTMTESLVQRAGINLRRKGNLLIIPRLSSINATTLIAEPDLSSAFAIAALAAASLGCAVFRLLPTKSLQPDSVFPEILRAMNCAVTADFCVRGPDQLKPISWNLRDCPDLFPVLSVLCALCKGRSILYGAPHLAFKESSRIESTAKLLQGLDCRYRMRTDGIEIFGTGFISTKTFDFDPNHDHRLAMAAAVAQSAGANVRILHPEVVNKSFPEFWSILKAGFR